MTIRLVHALLAATLSAAIAGCSTAPKVGSVSAPAVVAAAPIPANEVETIARLLDQGAVTSAKRRLDAALRRDPMNASLLVLRQGMEGDAQEDLGPTHHPYTVVRGDTMAGLAQRFLGNRLKSFQLARYNGIAPAALAPGQVIRIPGEGPRTEPERRAAAERPGAPRAVVERAPAPPPARAAPVARAADPAAAQRARTAGLAALNKGDVANAVALLQRAGTLDPGNAAIKQDLARARRIAATVQARR